MNIIMKKIIITIFCIACMSTGVIAQSGVRIGNYEFNVKKAVKDSVIQVYAEEDPCPPCPSENETRPQPKKTKHIPRTYNNFFCGIGFTLPDNGSDYYSALGNKSIAIDAGWIRRYQIARWFALGGTLNYTFYNYKLRDASNEPIFREEILNNGDFDMNNIRKQVFRSHNISVGAFARFNIIPSIYSNTGLFIDFGAQGDVVVDSYYLINTRSEGKEKFYNDNAYSPFIASAIARVGSGNAAFFARYRFTDIYNSKVLPMQLPPLTFGVQFGFK